MYNTNQEIFDAAYRGLASQGFERAYGVMPGGSEGCAYRSTEGRKCAVGHLIPDNLYDPKMENEIVGVLLEHYPSVRGIFPENVSFDFFENLQMCHDSGRTPESMKSLLHEFARNKGLTIPEVEQ